MPQRAKYHCATSLACAMIGGVSTSALNALPCWNFFHLTRYKYIVDLGSTMGEEREVGIMVHRSWSREWIPRERRNNGPSETGTANGKLTFVAAVTVAYVYLAQHYLARICRLKPCSSAESAMKSSLLM